MLTKPRKKKCPCGSWFIPRNSFQTACCVPGAQIRAEQKRAQEAKKVRVDTKARLTELKPLQYWLKRAEKAFNAWVRERDRGQPCISCGTYDSPEWHAGHFISVGASSALRFDPDNVALQCVKCNVFLSGNLTNYEIRLTAKIGQEAVERLKTAPRSKVWDRTTLEALEADYKARLKELK